MKEATLITKLKEKNYRICCAESCTGGMLSSALVGVSGASDVLDMGFITYANEAKIKLLGVDENTILQYGVVSEPVTAQMATGAAKAAECQVGVGISGIAGPGGATPTKPVGTVCFGFYIDGKVVTKTMHFEDRGRQQVRESAVQYAIDTLIELI